MAACSPNHVMPGLAQEKCCAAGTYDAELIDELTPRGRGLRGGQEPL